MTKKIFLMILALILFSGAASASIDNYDNYKELNATSVSGNPSFTKAQPVYWTCGDDTSTGEGDIVIDCGNVNDESDVAFVDENGNDFVPFEHESFDSNNGGVSWVYDDYVRDGNLDLYIAYGNGGSDQQNVTGVWNDNALMVQHLQDDPLTASDSTSNNNDGTVNNLDYLGAGQFNGAGDFFESYIDTFQVSSSSITILLYHNVSASNTDGHLFGSYDGTNQLGLYGNFDPDVGGLNWKTYDGSNHGLTGVTPPALEAGRWYQKVATFNSSNGYKLYSNASLLDSSPDTTFNLPTNNAYIGADNDNGTAASQYQGGIDEVRVYSDDKSSVDGWIQADLDASDDGGQTFFTQSASQTEAQEYAIHNPENTTYYSTSDTANINLEVTSTESVSNWEYSLDGGTNTSFTPNTTLQDVSSGSHELKVYADSTLAGTVNFEVVTEPLIDPKNSSKLFYSFDSFSDGGSTVIDDSGNSYDGTAVNGLSNGTGKVFTGSIFDGQNDRIEISQDSFVGSSNTEYSVSMWIKQDDLAGSEQLYHEGRDSDDSLIEIRMYNESGNNNYNEVSWYREGTGSFDSGSLPDLVDGNWHHAVFVKKSDEREIWFDGELANEVTGETYSSIAADSDTTLGSGTLDGGTSFTDYYNGSMDEVSIYDKGLNSSEIDSLYNLEYNKTSSGDSSDGSGSTTVNIDSVNKRPMSPETRSYTWLNVSLSSSGSLNYTLDGGSEQTVCSNCSEAEWKVDAADGDHNLKMITKDDTQWVNWTTNTSTDIHWAWDVKEVGAGTGSGRGNAYNPSDKSITTALDTNIKFTRITKNGTVKWTTDTFYKSSDSPTSAPVPSPHWVDWDNDGTMEWLAAIQTSRVWVIDGSDGSLERELGVSSADEAWNVLRMANLTNDGKLQAISGSEAADGDENVTAWNSDGSIYCSLNKGAAAQSMIADDFDEDGLDEFAFITAKSVPNTIYVYDDDCTEMWSVDDTGQSDEFNLGDVDPDTPGLEFIHQENGEQDLQVRNATDGTLLYEREGLYTEIQHTVTGDFNDNGRVDILAASKNVDKQLKYLWGNNLSDRWTTNNVHDWATAGTVDINNDGKEEIFSANGDSLVYDLETGEVIKDLVTEYDTADNEDLNERSIVGYGIQESWIDTDMMPNKPGGQISWVNNDDERGSENPSNDYKIYMSDVIDSEDVDNTPPSIQITTIQNTTYSSSERDLNVTTDEKANFSYNVDGGTNTTVDENDQDLNESLSSLSDGSHCANVYAEDSNGNTGYKQRCFTVDTTSPSSSFTFSPSNPNVSETIDFDGSGSSDSTSSIVAYRWDFQNDSTNDATGQTVQTSYNSEGNYSVRLEVEDSAGNIDVSYQTVEVKGQLSVQEKGFVVQACSATPFCITDINSFPNPVKYIDQAIGSSLDDAWKVNATGKAGNSYNVTANFSNTNPYVPDAESNTVTVNLKDSSTNTNSAPSASFTASTSDLDVSVDGSGSSDSDGSISSYSWDFGDGSTASGSTASHTYSSDGTYTITLTVTDDDGAQDSTSKDVSVSSSSSGGGSGGDSGGDSGDTVDVNGTKGQLVGPHIESRFLEQTFNVTDGNGTTEIVGGNSHTFTVVDVINDTHADIKVDGNNRTEVEGNEFFLDGNAIRISTILNNSLRKEVAFTEQSFDYSKSDFYLAYTYQINNSGSVELQYRETGPGNSWITAEELSFSTSQNQTFNNYIARDVQNGIYEARVRVNKSGTSEISGPIGFYVGEKTSDIKVTKPNDGATRKVSYTSGNSTNGEYDLDLNYQVYARSNSSINSQSYYYKDGKYYLLNKPNSVSREYSDDDSLLEEFREYLSGSFLEKLGSPFAILFGVQEDSTLNVNTTKIVSGGTGQYVAYANVTSNESVNYNATSIGKRITLVETSPVNTKDRRQKEVKEQSDYEETNDDLHINDSVNKTVNTSSGNKTFEDPYFYPIAPANGAELLTSDKDNFSTKLYFDMAHNGSLTDYNKSVVLLEEGKKVFERKVITKGSQHILEVNSSDVTWEYDKQYKWYGNFTRNSSTLYTTVNKINGTSTFKLSKPGLKELASRWFDPVVGGFTTVYGFGADHVKFWIFLIMTSGIYIISRYKADAFIAKVLGGISYIFFAWFGYVPGIFNLAVVGIAAFIIALKLRRGEVNL